MQDEDCLRTRQCRITEEVISQIREQVIEVRDIRNTGQRRVGKAQLIQLARGSVPIHSGSTIYQVVQLHDIPHEEQVFGRATYITSFEGESPSHFSTVREIPGVVLGRDE